MSESGRRVVVAAAVLAVLSSVVAQRPDVQDPLGVEHDRRSESAVIVEAVPVGVLPAATRPRTSLDGESPSAAGSTKTRVSGLVLVLPALVLTVAVRWWHLAPRVHRRTVPSRRASLPALRAPPTFA